MLCSCALVLLDDPFSNLSFEQLLGQTSWPSFVTIEAWWILIFFSYLLYIYVISDHVSYNCHRHTYLSLPWSSVMRNTTYYQHNYSLFYIPAITDQVTLILTNCTFSIFKRKSRVKCKYLLFLGRMLLKAFTCICTELKIIFVHYIKCFGSAIVQANSLTVCNLDIGLVHRSFCFRKTKVQGYKEIFWAQTQISIICQKPAQNAYWPIKCWDLRLAQKKVV
jgi:hypothetical protein